MKRSGLIYAVRTFVRVYRQAIAKKHGAGGNHKIALFLALESMMLIPGIHQSYMLRAKQKWINKFLNRRDKPC